MADGYDLMEETDFLDDDIVLTVSYNDIRDEMEVTDEGIINDADVYAIADILRNDPQLVIRTLIENLEL